MIFSCFCSLLIYFLIFKSTFNKDLREIPPVSKSLDLDDTVQLDLGAYCFERLSTDDILSGNLLSDVRYHLLKGPQNDKNANNIIDTSPTSP